MIDQVPLFVEVIFLLTVFLTLGLFYRATNNSRIFLGIASTWIVLQSSVILSLFYTKTDVLPPRFLLLVAPLFITIVLLFVTKAGRVFIDSLDMQWLTAIHLVRIPVELCLYWLLLSGIIPELMTFAGWNFDILAGISAPLILFLTYYKSLVSNNGLLLWNIIGLLLVTFIVVIAVLSAPFPFQQLGLNQPNIAVFYFPFALLPGFVVPIVIISHLASIRQLIISKKQTVLN
jgi:hypothetical protein